MNLSKESQKWFDKIKREYSITDEAGLLLLQTAFEAFDEMREAQQAMEDTGAVYTDRFDQPKPHPAAKEARASRAQMLKALKQLNLDIEPLRDGPGRPPLS